LTVKDSRSFSVGIKDNSRELRFDSFECLGDFEEVDSIGLLAVKDSRSPAGVKDDSRELRFDSFECLGDFEEVDSLEPLLERLCSGLNSIDGTDPLRFSTGEDGCIGFSITDFGSTVGSIGAFFTGIHQIHRIVRIHTHKINTPIKHVISM